MIFERVALFIILFVYGFYIVKTVYRGGAKDSHIFRTAIFIGGASTFFGYFLEFISLEPLGWLIGLFAGLWLADKDAEESFLEENKE